MGPAFNLSSLSQQAQSLIPPETVKSQLSQIPAYRENRERAAVIFKQGLAAYEAYIRVRPYAFAASLATAAACGWGLWKRKGAEARALYGAGLAVSLAVAWFTRPQAAAAGVKSTVKSGDPAKAGIVAAIDAKRAQYAAEDPAWADKTMTEVAALPGVAEQVAAAPALRAILG